MSSKIQEVSESIKSKLSFEDYKTSERTEAHKHISTEKQKHIITEKKIKKTFYIPEFIVNQFEDYYIQCLLKNKKIDKSDLITQAIINLIDKKDLDIKIF